MKHSLRLQEKAMHNEEHSLHLPPPDPPELEPILAELASGHALKLEARHWRSKPTVEELTSGRRPEPYFAIRIYCTENALPKRLLWSEELRDGTDFDVSRIAEIWEWLGELAGSRTMFEFDEFDDFLHHVIDGICQLSAQEPDATEHYQYLPGLTAPHAFDRVDDSIYTDQHDGEPERSDEPDDQNGT